MSFSGAAGTGSFRSIISSATTPPPTIPHQYYPMAQELLSLYRTNISVARAFYVRDKQFSGRFPGTKAMDESFKYTTEWRRSHHMNWLMPAIRKRTIIMSRVARQQEINAKIIAASTSPDSNNNSNPSALSCRPLCSASIEAMDNPKDPRNYLRTPDIMTYLAPTSQRTGTNANPNYWQHDSMKHVIPVVKWRRFPELGGITRVVSAPGQGSVDIRGHY
eukprot:Tbor_TRINITY_DN5487_c5_g1::TRINITY_DN5487_c5_g1_i3::g.24178::m.24178